MRRARITSVIAACAALAVTAPAAPAAGPMTLGLGGSVTWSGGPTTSATPIGTGFGVEHVTDAVVNCDAPGASCDDTKITPNLAGAWRPASFLVTIAGTSLAPVDHDLYVYRELPDGSLQLRCSSTLLDVTTTSWEGCSFGGITSPDPIVVRVVTWYGVQATYDAYARLT